MAAAGNTYGVFTDTAPGNFTVTGNFLQTSVQDTITAKASGNQSTATPLVANWNRVTTVASAGDAVLLPLSAQGDACVVANATATNAMNIYPQSGEKINLLSANTAFSIPANKVCEFYCVTQGLWLANLSA